jgi:hypothetical protein
MQMTASGDSATSANGTVPSLVSFSEDKNLSCPFSLYFFTSLHEFENVSRKSQDAV